MLDILQHVQYEFPGITPEEHQRNPFLRCLVSFLIVDVQVKDCLRPQVQLVYGSHQPFVLTLFLYLLQQRFQHHERAPVLQYQPLDFHLIFRFHPRLSVAIANFSAVILDIVGQYRCINGNQVDIHCGELIIDITIICLDSFFQIFEEPSVHD